MNISIALFITTAFLALGTITFAALDMAFQRSHSRKSIRPFCNVHKNITRSDISIRVQNAGLGPMIIKKLVLLKNPTDSLENAVQLTEAFGSTLNYTLFIHDTDGYVLAPNQEADLLQFSPSSKDKNAMSVLKDQLSSFTLLIQYADVYDDIYEKKEPFVF